MVVLGFAGAALAACGDTGDHFLDFSKTTFPTLVSTYSLAMPLIPGHNGASGKYTLYVTGYNNGQAIPAGTQLQNPIVLKVNAPGTLGLGGHNGPFASSRSYYSAPGPITVNYVRPPKICNPYLAIAGFNMDANPQVVTLNLTPSCPASSPSPQAR